MRILLKSLNLVDILIIQFYYLIWARVRSSVKLSWICLASGLPGRLFLNMKDAR